MRFYKTHDPKVLEAQRQYQADIQAVQQQGEAFAALYPNARPLFRTDACGRDFYGLRFEPELKDPLWTKPKAQTGYAQRPLASPVKGSKGEERRQQIAALAELNTAYRERFPTLKADRDPVWAALGTDWGSAMFGGFQGFEQDGCYYFKTGITSPAEHWVEIVGSEYDLAMATHNAAAAASQALKAAA